MTLDRDRIPAQQADPAPSSSKVPLLAPLAPPTGVERYLSKSDAAELEQRRQLAQFAASTTAQNDQAWHYSKSSDRKHKKLVEELGLDGAVREKLDPSRLSFRQELKRRPIDRQILEEIYRGLHGVRVERKLKKGVNWEHWIAKGEGTAPVFTASQNAKVTFGMGGKVDRIARATHRSHFPQSGATMPEVAFIGRTGSGKSCLINAIVNAHVCPYGHTQGTTRSCDFYSVGGRLVVVDLPGYGYFHPLYCPEMDSRNAIALAKEYLRQGGTGGGGGTRPMEEEEGARGRGGGGGGSSGRVAAIRNLKRVFVCVSARGVQHLDVQYMDLLERLEVPFSVVLTKTDAAPIAFLAKLADHTRCRLLGYKHCHELMLTSSLRLSGIEKLQNLLGNIAVRGREGSQDAIDTDFSSIV